MGIIKRSINKLKKQLFIKQFCRFDSSSCVGKNGFGKGCKLSGLKNISIGKECYFGTGTELLALTSHFEQQLDSCLIIGNHVRCIGGCRITCAGKIILDDDVLIGPAVFITDHNHGMNPEIKGGYSKQPLIVKNVCICEGVWLGQRVCVMPGVTIGAHSIIGANSVVTHDIPAYSIAVGAPAIVVKCWDFNQHKWVLVEMNSKMKSIGDQRTS